jgi:Skp family chaperone for outer membrane proteins
MVAGCFLAGPAMAQQKIATVDMRKVFDNYWKRKEGDAAIKDRAASMEKDWKAMVADFNKAKEEYQKLVDSANDQAVSTDERAKRKKAVEDKLKQLRTTEETVMQYEKTARETVARELERMRDSIVGEIRTVVNAKAQSGGYTLVIDSAAESANRVPILLYTNDKDNDLTESILAQLNAAAPTNLRSSETPKPAGSK